MWLLAHHALKYQFAQQLIYLLSATFSNLFIWIIHWPQFYEFTFPSYKVPNKKVTDCVYNSIFFTKKKKKKKHTFTSNVKITLGDKEKADVEHHVLCFSALLSGAEFWNDCIFSLDDLERLDGCNWKREPDCGCSQVRASVWSGSSLIPEALALDIMVIFLAACSASFHMMQCSHCWIYYFQDCFTRL